MTTLGAAIIGCGAIYPLHAKTVSALDGVSLKAFVDPREERAARAAGEYGGEVLTDYREILERDDIQVVHLCTPHYLHAPMAVEFLEAGKHVLTEKPMGETLEAADRMIAAADRSAARGGGQLGVCFQNRYNEASVIIKRTIDSGELGRVICMKGVVTWHRTADYYTSSGWRGSWETEGGGVLINQTIHTLDLIQWFGGQIASVKGSVSTDVLEGVIEVEDTAHACIEFTNGARAVYYATNAYLTNSPVEIEIVCERGTLIQRRESLYLLRDGEETLLCEPAFNETGGKSYWGASHGLLIRDYYDCVREGRPFGIDGRTGRNGLWLVKSIYESSRLGQKVPYGQA